MKSVITILLVFLICLACSSGRGDLTNPGNVGSSPGANRTNLAVTWDNLLPAFEEFNGLLNFTLNKTLYAFSEFNTFDLPVRFLGNYNSYAIAYIVEPDTLLEDTVAALHFRVEFINFFSESGALFISGELDQYAQWSYQVPTKPRVSDFNINGTVEFSGDYACRVLFDEFKLSPGKMDAYVNVPESKPQFGVITVFSEGADSIRFNPDY